MAKTKKAKKWLIGVLCALLTLVLIAGGYFAYVLIAYYRIPDNQPAEIMNNQQASLETDKTYSLLSYNIGFAAYTPDFGFFMDGGKESRAFSKESVEQVMAGISQFFKEQDPDLAVFEEVDIDSTRNYHVDERVPLRQAATAYTSTFARNYDSPYLFYPFLEPHGKSVSGLLTFSKFTVTDSLRRSLPIENSLMKLVDLDRCYTVNRMPVANGKELVLYAVHLSAYSSDGSIATQQLQMLLADMQSEYEKGNYALCTGDFNKDLLGNSEEWFGVSTEDYTWAQPFPTEYLDGTDIRLIAPLDKEHPVPSCRNADGPYNPDQLTLTVDGFLVSANIAEISSQVVDLGFCYSDHNPVKLEFALQP